jgi:hypothetical protein
MLMVSRHHFQSQVTKSRNRNWRAVKSVAVTGAGAETELQVEGLGVGVVAVIVGIVGRSARQEETAANAIDLLEIVARAVIEMNVGDMTAAIQIEEIEMIGIVVVRTSVIAQGRYPVQIEDEAGDRAVAVVIDVRGKSRIMQAHVSPKMNLKHRKPKPGKIGKETHENSGLQGQRMKI